MKNALFVVLAASMLTATALPAHAFVLPVLRVKVMVPVAQPRPVEQDWRAGNNRFEQRNDRDDWYGKTDRSGRKDRFRKHPLPVVPPAFEQASREHPVLFHH